MDNTKDRVKPRCQNCNEPIQGRSDKRFCNASCRTAFHNLRNEGTLRVVRAVNKVLLKNYQILESFWEKGVTETTHQLMLQSGFNFNYFTSIQNLKTGAAYLFCYDIGYSKMDDAHIRIIKKERNRRQ